jgi:SAM-dependent methyltransferase
MAYRRRFIYRHLFAGLDLNGTRVIELACGSGHNTLELLRRFPRADVRGLDISPKACAAFRRATGRECFEVDLTDRWAVLPPPADVAFVVGGLHHCHNALPAAFGTIGRLLRGGGLLLMVEPNARFFLDRVRRAWYARDRWFREEEEAALDHDRLLELAGSRFREVSVRYVGGPAYFLIQNSLVMRVPLRLKPAIAPLLFAGDSLYERLPGSAPFPVVIARWMMSAGDAGGAPI